MGFNGLERVVLKKGIEKVEVSRRGFLGILGLGALGLAGCLDRDEEPQVEPPIEPPEENYPPQAILDVSPVSGRAPLEIRIRVDGSDENGEEDIINYEARLGNETVTGLSPIDITRYLPEGLYEITGIVTDREGATGNASVNIEVLRALNPALRQTVDLQNNVDFMYNATLVDIESGATLEVRRNGELVTTREINPGEESYSELFLGMEKGSYDFTLRANSLEDSIDSEVPDYSPEVDLSGINPVFNEDDYITIPLPNPEDKNPEDAPVYTNVVASLDGKTVSSIEGIEGNELTITNANGQTGDFEIEVEFGCPQGGYQTAVIQGHINNMINISGQLQDNEMHEGRYGRIKITSLDGILLTDADGNPAEVETTQQGYFSVRIPEQASGYLVKGRHWAFGDWYSFTRTVPVSGGEDVNLEGDNALRIVDYSGLDVAGTGGGVTPQMFRAYVEEVNFSSLVRWDLNNLQGVSIFDNPITGEQFGAYRTLIEDIINENGIVNGLRSTVSGSQLVIDNSQHYSTPNGEVVMENGWIGIYPSTETEGAVGLTDVGTYAGEVKKALIKMNPNYFSEENLRKAIPHEV
ncbi:MAG: hypothetical protein ABIH49_00150, partial [archaeon]